MSLSVIFNGIELNDLIDVEYGLNLTDGADWQPELRALSGGNGSDFLETSYGSKSITMPFRIKNEINSKFDKLQRILNVSSAQRLSFGNLKNRYFVAIPSSKIDLIVEKNGFIARGTITWIIPDGVSRSTDTKLVTATMIDGILTANVNNNGSDVVWPTYRIKNNDENGWNGIVHSGGILEIGNRDETDGQDYKQSEVLLDTTDFNESGWSKWSGNYLPGKGFDLSGTLSVSGTDRDRGLRLNSVGNNTGLYNGGGIVYTLQGDSEGEVGAKNFYAFWETYFWAGAMGQTALQDIIFWADDEIIARWYVLKSDKNGNSAVARAFAGDGRGGLTQVYSRDFKASHLDAENSFNRPRGSMDFMKEGGKLTFYYWGQYPSITVPELADKKITKVSTVITNYDKRSGIKYVTNNAIRKLRIVKLKVPKWRDVQNRFSAGSEIVVDTETASVYVNGLPANDEAVNPPLFAPLQPGNNKIEFYQSDWSQSTPEITVEWKERYL